MTALWNLVGLCYFCVLSVNALPFFSGPCPPDKPEASGLFCYQLCDTGYTPKGPLCVQDCPQDARSVFLTFCWVQDQWPTWSATYTRAMGFPLWRTPDIEPVQINATTDPNQILLMTFNLRYGTADDGPNSWEYRLPLVTDFLTSTSPDIMGTQEGMLFQLEEIQEAFGSNFMWIGRGRDNGRQGGEFSAIFYRPERFDLLEHGTFWFAPNPTDVGALAWGADHPRICTWAVLSDVYSTEVRILIVLNVHLDHDSEESRINSAKLLIETAQRKQEEAQAKYIDDVNASGMVYTFITGDFNSYFSPAPEIQHVNVNGFMDTALKNSDTSTYHGFSPDDGIGLPKIDFIFAETWRVGSNVLNILDDHVDTFNENGRYPSDHYPVWSLIAFNQSTTQ